MRKLWIEGPAGRLEARLRAAHPERAAAVVAHPHPLHGGTLHNPVVFHSDRELNRAGFTTLRFDFRGAGTSQGAHDEGRGEVADVGAAASWLRGITPGRPLLVVGYSFGAWCAIRYALTDPGIAALVAIGLPVGVYPFDEIARLDRPLAVVQGDADELGPLPALRERLARASAPTDLRVVPSASHLFPGKAREVGTRVAAAATDLLRRLGPAAPDAGLTSI